MMPTRPDAVKGPRTYVPMTAGPDSGHHRPMHPTRLVPALFAATAIAASGMGCGGAGDDKASSSSAGSTNTTSASSSDGSAPGAGGRTLALAADPGGKIAYDKRSLTAKAGTVTLAFTNASQVPHAVEIEGHGVEKETKTIQAGKASLTAKLKPGAYTFYCPVSDHEGEGMKGTLTVR